jgi:hypothetical protein
MASGVTHASVGSALTQAEWEASTSHTVGNFSPTGYIYPGTGAAEQSTRYIYDNGSDIVNNVGGNNFTINTSGSQKGLHIVSENNDQYGVQYNALHDSTTPAVDDYPLTIRCRANDDADNVTTFGFLGWKLTDVSDAGGTEAAKFEIHNRNASADNLAMWVNSDGQVHADLGAGAGNVTVFDKHDDAVVLRQASLMNIKPLIDMGIAYIHPEHHGYMMNYSKFNWLLAGGIYQNRAKIDAIINAIWGIPGVKEALQERLMIHE